MSEVPLYYMPWTLNQVFMAESASLYATGLAIADD